MGMQTKDFEVRILDLMRSMKARKAREGAYSRGMNRRAEMNHPVRQGNGKIGVLSELQCKRKLSYFIAFEEKSALGRLMKLKLFGRLMK